LKEFKFGEIKQIYETLGRRRRAKSPLMEDESKNLFY
jgi:hypothetical protein